jgi:hypothetical protein
MKVTNYAIPKEAYWYMILTSGQIVMNVPTISQSVKNIITLGNWGPCVLFLRLLMLKHIQPPMKHLLLAKAIHTH